MSNVRILIACAALLTPAVFAETLRYFEKNTLSELFYCEGATYGDYNKDGKGDVVSGPYWYEGPDFKVKHELYNPKPFDKRGYSQNTKETFGSFFAYTFDFNKDGWDDIMMYGFPGAEAAWYQNPQGKEGHWKRHKVFDVVDNESPFFIDITGDGKPEIVCSTPAASALPKDADPKEKQKELRGQMGYAEADWNDPSKPWKFHPVSAKGHWQKFTHGMGVGDVNGDGKQDIIDRNGWWEQPADLSKEEPWKHHPAKFGGSGGAHMYAYDVNGDGKNDIITSMNAHYWGLSWFEQGATDDKGNPAFKEHVIMSQDPAVKNKYGVQFGEPHAIDFIDMDGDGLKDIVTGKRHWSHAPKSTTSSEGVVADVNDPPRLFYFKLVRGEKRVDFVPHLIDGDSGVGVQIVAGDVNGDKLPDVVVGNKRGTFVMIQKTKEVSKEEWEKAQPKLVAAPAAEPKTEAK